MAEREFVWVLLCKPRVATKHFNEGQRTWVTMITGACALKVKGRYRGRHRWIRAWIRWNWKCELDHAKPPPKVKPCMVSKEFADRMGAVTIPGPKAEEWLRNLR